MPNLNDIASFCGDKPAAAENMNLADRRELALVAVERSRMPMVVTDPQQPDNPIIMANQAFIDLTGFNPQEIIGQNCRFLQGPGTSRTVVAQIRQALARGDDCIELELVNYRKDGSSFINALFISAIKDDHGNLLYYFASQQDVTSEHKAIELEASERRLLMEVDHRTLNALALIQSIVRLSRAEDVEGLSQSIIGRVSALSLTHRLLAEQRWRSVNLTELIKQLLVAHAVADRVLFKAQSVELAPEIVQPLGLVIHELLTNAQAHGALVHDTGFITLDCRIEDGALVLHWLEPICSKYMAPFIEGFGLQIIQAVVEGQLGGYRKIEVTSDVLDATIVVPLDAVPAK